MKMYRVKHNLAKDLMAGIYTRSELKLDELNMLEDKEGSPLEIVDIPIRCFLLQDNGFKKIIELQDFCPEIRIPIRGEDISINTVSEGTKVQMPKDSSITFLFDKKIRGENKFLYYER